MINATAEIYANDPLPGDWLVTCRDPSGDGGFISAIFAGVAAEDRAVEYARQNFREFQHCAPHQWPFLST